MPTIADISVLDFEIFIFILVRVSFMVVLLPVIGGRQLPSRVKVGFSFFMSVIIYTQLKDFEMVLPDTIPGFFVACLKEVYVGAIMGFASSMLFVSLNIAGRIIDHNTGFSMIQTINPMTDSNESVIGQIQFIIFSLILIVTGNHLHFIRMIFDSFEMINLLSAQWSLAPINQIFIKVTALSFVYGIKLSAPILVPLLLTTAALAIVARVMPQVNVWLVGMPLKIGIGLISVSFVMPLVWYVFQKQIVSVQASQIYLLKIMGGVGLQ